MRMVFRSILATAGCVAVGAAVLGGAYAQEFRVEGSKPTLLIKTDISGAPNKQVVAFIYEVQPGTMVPLHYHHGDEFHLVLSGEWAAEVAGKAVHVMKAGDSQYVANDGVHGGKVVGNVPLRLLGLMIVDKDKPLVERPH
ncbi:MAG TPA: cupin domain-containing protein [Burkholderiales bacterium]|nr:cupin domain-containing protein [Burkholderiales bacterium]